MTMLTSMPRLARAFAGATGALLMGVSGMAIAQTSAPAPAPAPSAPAATTPAPAAPAAAAKTASPGSGSGSAAAVTPKGDPAVAKLMASCKADVEKYCADSMTKGKTVAGSGSGSAAGSGSGSAAGSGSGSGSAAGSGSGSAAAPAVAKGKGRNVVACLNTNIASLTAECKTAFEARKAAAKAKKS